jgi:tetratricopeptide (TPR) repeat protein
MQAYPRASEPHDALSGFIYPPLGQYEKAAEEAKEAVRLKPEFPISYANLMFGYISLDRLDDAKATYEQALERKLDLPFFHFALYPIAFLQNDVAGMAQQVAWSAGKPGVEDCLLNL